MAGVNSQQSTVNSQQRGHGRRQKGKGDPAVPKPCRRLRSSTYQRFLVDSIMDKTPSILSSFPDDLVFFKSRVTTKLTNRCVTATGNVNVNVNALCFVGESYQSTSLPKSKLHSCCEIQYIGRYDLTRLDSLGAWVGRLDFAFHTRKFQCLQCFVLNRSDWNIDE